MPTRYSRPAQALALVLVFVGLFWGCSSDLDLGVVPNGGPSRLADTDECGNGMDDDGDGQIDEGCFCGSGETQACFTGTYPNRLVGACADGVMGCDATGSVEFGSWGVCTGDTTSGEEVCDGVADDDCDGAVDEDCPCTVGESRGCGLEFVVAPCTGGTQTCTTSGVWTGCEGAVGPSAELCSDDVDNDCDGEINEGCGCVPQPEVCDDGEDNDCDGVVDEPACRGMSGCTPTAEVCGSSVDEDCDGLVDEDCGPADCACTWSADGGWTDLVDARISSNETDFNWHAVHNADDGVVGIAYVEGRSGGLDGDGALHFTAVDDTTGATVVADRAVLDMDSTGPAFSGFVWTGGHYVALWWASRPAADGVRHDTAFMARISAAGSLVGAPVPVSDTGRVSRWPNAVRVGDELHVAWSERTVSGLGSEGYGTEEMFYRRFGLDLAPRGPVVRLTNNAVFEAARPVGIAWSGTEAAVIFDRGGSSTEVVMSVVRGDAVVAEVELGTGFESELLTNVSVTFGADAFLGCWSEPRTYSELAKGTTSCRRVGRDAVPLGGPFAAATPKYNEQSVSVTFDGCGFLVLSSGVSDSTSDAWNEVIPIDAAGSADVASQINLGAPVSRPAFLGAQHLLPIGDRVLVLASAASGDPQRSTMRWLSCR